jgi:predicted  nucleic acid-binding Zn-ribbon protein
VAELDAFKQEIDESQARAAAMQSSKVQLEEIKTDLAGNLKRDKAELKKKREVLKEVEKLAGQDLRVLQQEVSQMNDELTNLRDEWEEYKKPIKEEIFETKQ